MAEARLRRAQVRAQITRHIARSACARRLLAFCWVALAVQCASATDYFINGRCGNDDDTGTTNAAPWKSLKKLEAHTFAPGDNILFAKGSSYTGGFVFRSSGSSEHPITFSSYSAGPEVELQNDRKALADLFVKYGAGPAPSFTNPDWATLNGNIFQITGSHIVIDGLYFHDNTNPPGSDHKNKNVQKMGAVYLAPGSHDCIIRNCEFFHTPVAIKIKGTHNLVAHNYCHDASEPMARTWGPIAIMIVSPDNEIAYNTISNYGSYGGPYGSDGGVIELDGVDDAFNGKDISIHHNTSTNNHGFLELAGRNIERINIDHNLSDDRNQFLGGGSMTGITVQNNTIIRTREPNVDRYVFWTFAPEATSITVTNNIFVLAKDLKVFGPIRKPVGHQRVPIGNQPHDHNLYFADGASDPIGIEPGAGDVIADPVFIDSTNHNFRLRKDSPAIDKATSSSCTQDLDGRSIPQGLGPDIGAYEY